MQVERRDVDRLRSAVSARLGLDFDDGKLGLLADALGRRLVATGLGASEYLARLEGAVPPRDELGALAKELTIGETYFFRNVEQYRALVEAVLPGRLAAAKGRPLRILSAGCASGEEPYSLAMYLMQKWPGAAGIELRAVDVNPAALARARRARYSTWSLRETSAELRGKWFQAHGAEYAVDPTIISAVKFEERNLAIEDPELWAEASWDVVFCRNVLMYFVPETMRRAIGRIARALVPGGTLFLGHAETLRGVSADFHLRHSHDTFYYEVRPREEWRELGPAVPAPSVSAAVDPLAGAESWVEVIQRGTRRIQDLADGPAGGPAGEAGQPLATPRSPVDLTVALELLQSERFDEAIQHLEHVSQDRDEHDAEVLLVRAALLTHAGRLEAAEKVCQDLLAIEELEAGAHYLLALCREGRGDRAGAAEHDQIAIYLDPTFAMPRLHQGLAARRQGDKASAVRDLSAALLLLEREQTSRLLLFGGGFRREALVALCRAELIRSGGQP